MTKAKTLKPLTKLEKDHLDQVINAIRENKECPTGLKLKTLTDRCTLRVEQYVTWVGEGRTGRIVTILTGKYSQKTTARLTWLQQKQKPSTIYDGRSVRLIRQLGLLTPDDVKGRQRLKPVSLKPEPVWLNHSKPHH